MTMVKINAHVVAVTGHAFPILSVRGTSWALFMVYVYSIYLVGIVVRGARGGGLRAPRFGLEI